MKDELLNSEEITSRLSWLTSERAQNLWGFLRQYVQETEDAEGYKHIMIPAFRVLDALGMGDGELLAYTMI